MCTETGKAPSEKVGFPCFFWLYIWKKRPAAGFADQILFFVETISANNFIGKITAG